MKRVTLIMGALALVLGLSQCRKPNAPTINCIGETQHIIIKANNGNDGSKVNVEAAGAALNLTWEGNETITVSGGATGTLVCKSVTGANATFEGDITKTSGAELLFWTGASTVTYTDQVGTTDWIKEKIRLEGTSEYKSDGNYGTINMTLPYAILKLDLKALGTATPGNAVTITKVVSGETVTVASVKDVTNAENNPYYVAVPADGTYTEYTFSGNGKTAKTTWKIDANVFYTNNDDVGAAIVIAPPFATVVTIPVCAVHSTCASSGGVVTGTGVEEQGVCWGTGANPTVDGSHYVHNYEYATGSLTPKNTGANNTFTGFMSGLTAGTTYHVRAYIRKGTQVVYGDDITFTTLASEPEIQYVNLGLPSGTLWATCNLGATKPEGYGDYYQWGDLAACSTISLGTTYYVNCGWQSYRYAANSTTTFTKYCPTGSTSYWYSGAGSPDGNLNFADCDYTDDCVRQTLGGDWRMPTEAEFNELKDNTTRTWKAANESITIGGNTVSMPVAGYYFVSTITGYTDKYIFLPAAGRRSVTSLYYAGFLGNYWSSSLGTGYPYTGRYLYFDSSNFYMNDNLRYCGLSVRPVLTSQK